MARRRPSRQCCFWPYCARRSRRAHSRYTRTIADVPCGDTPVIVQLRTRRFWCRMRWCRRRIFCERVPDLVAPWARRTARLQELAGGFRALVRTHDPTALACWLRQADQSAFPEFHGFADGLRADRAAVEAGLTFPWSQGQVEGHVNRLNTLKRAMFGRARFDLLRLRVLRVA